MSETIDTEKTLPNGCGYMGKDFGASYIDSQCFGGRLYDLDDCEGSHLYEPMDYKPCPECKHEEWLAGVLTECSEEGAIAFLDGKERTAPYEASKLRYPKDIDQMAKEWLAGFDQCKAEESEN